MRKWPFLLMFLLATGCFVPVRTDIPDRPESVVRQELRRALPRLVQSSLERDGWEATIVKVNEEALVSQNVGEEWQEWHLVLDLETKHAGETRLLPVSAYLPALRGLRTKLRDVVEQLQGEQTDYSFREAYKERVLEFLYTSARIEGRIQVRMFPLRDAPEETLTRLEITLREQSTE